MDTQLIHKQHDVEERSQTYKKHITILIPSLAGGGAEAVCVTVANGLTSCGWKVDLVLLSGRKNKYGDRLDSTVNLIYLPARSVGTSIPSLARYILTCKPKVILCFNYEFTVAAQIIKSIFFRKYSIVMRNINCISKRKESAVGIKSRLLIYPLTYWAVKKTSLVINQCEDMRADLVREGLAPCRSTSVIYNPLSESVREFKARQNIKNVQRENYFLWVGRLEEQKDPLVALKSFAAIACRFNNISLKILGEGSMMPFLIEYVERKELTDRVEFLGFVQKPFAEMYYARALLLTSRFEGFPNVVLEALYLGTPAIAFACPTGPSELIQHDVNGYLINDRSEKNLATAMATVASGRWRGERVKLADKFDDQALWKDTYNKLLEGAISA